MTSRENATSKGSEASKAAVAWVPTAIEQREVASLRPADSNPRKHPRAQIEQLAERYRQVGFTKPMLVRADGRIIAGHGRWEAAKLAGLTTVPVIVAPESWTDRQCREEHCMSEHGRTQAFNQTADVRAPGRLR